MSVPPFAAWICNTVLYHTTKKMILTMLTNMVLSHCTKTMLDRESDAHSLQNASAFYFKQKSLLTISEKYDIILLSIMLLLV